MNLPANPNNEHFQPVLRLIHQAKSPAFAVCAGSQYAGCHRADPRRPGSQRTGFQHPGSRRSGSRCTGSQAPAWEPRSRSSSFARRKAGASNAEFPSWSLGTSDNVLELGERV